MPFSGPGDESLPSNVKKLSAARRQRWVSVFNSSHSRCKGSSKECDTVAFRNANGVIKNASTTYAGLLGGSEALGRSFIELAAAEPPDTINILPPPGTYDHPVWGEFEVTEEGNQQFVDNLNNQVYQEFIALDAEHEGKLSGAVGYIIHLDMNEDGSVEADVNWTDRGKRLIKDDSYKYISPEWYEEWKDPSTQEEFTNVLVGGALTTRPYFKQLRSLVASERGLYDIEDGEDEGVLVEYKEAVDHGEEEEKDKKKKRNKKNHMKTKEEKMAKVDELVKEADELEEGEKQSFFQRLATSLKATVSFGSDEEDDDDKESDDDEDSKEKNNDKPGDDDEEGDSKTATEFRALSGRVETAEKAREASEKRVGVLEAVERTRRYRDIILGRDEEGTKAAKEASTSLHPMVGEIDDKMKIMTSLTEGSDAFKAYVAGERENSNRLHEAGTFSEIGQDSHGGDVQGGPVKQFEAKIATLRAADKDLSEADAISKVAEDDPKLYDAYDMEKTGRKVSRSS